MKKNQIFRLLAALLAAMMLLAACEKTPDGGETTAEEQTTEPAPVEISPVIAENGATEYKFIRPEETSAPFRSNFSSLVQDVNAATGASFPIGTDWVSPKETDFDYSAPEILVGATSRAESAEILASLPENSYTIRRVGKKIVILGKDENLTTLAMQTFRDDVIGSGKHFSGGVLSFAEGDEITVTQTHPMDPAWIIASGLSYSVAPKEILHCPPVGDYNVTQGACTDGTNIYFVLRQAVDSTCVICKYLLSDLSLVKVSGSLPLGHGSDITYDAKNHRLVVARGNTEGKILGIVDPDTLEFVKDVNITAGAGAITYNEKLNQYVIGQGGTSWILLDESFKVRKSLDRKVLDKATSRGYITQGLGSDDDFVYFPMNKDDNSENILVVYTWEGKYVCDVHIPVAIESESMFMTGGNCYVSFYKSKNGAFLYRVDFILDY